MTFGATIRNTAGEVLISSELKNLHFVTKILGSSSTPVVSATTSFGGRSVQRYRVNNCSAVPVPFLKILSGREAAVISVDPVDSTTWDVDVLGDNHAPDMYVFADATTVLSTDLSGLIVFNENGTKAFDSRSRPLQVSNAAYVVPPDNPRTSFSPSGLNPKYCQSNAGSSHSSQYTPDAVNNYVVSMPVTPMFFHFSVAQTEREATFYASEQECDTFSAYNECIALGRKYEWWSTYWAFYRSTISWQGPDSLKCQWTTAEFDCHWEEKRDSQSFGIDTGGSSSAGGAFPLNNQTVNQDQALVLIADYSLYD